ncbi:complement C1q 2 [Labeo rohita]|uniref:Complement C1q 2 n=1 Tax=Labeo rohita TaxID=84645 RepID=A0A498LN41_LABRO|nr:complement C1q 2 [Labeo rohita]
MRKEETARQTNAHVYYAEYAGHKLHMDQNEKLMDFGVTKVVASDGFSGKIMGFSVMLIKNNLIIYDEVYREICLNHGLFDQLRVDHGCELYLCLYQQDNPFTPMSIGTLLFKACQDRTMLLKERIFTAPVRGLYYFSFFYHCGTERGTGLALYRDGKLEALTQHNPSSDSPQNGGNGLTLLLEKGDQVYIVLRKDKWIWDAENVTVFGGFLIDSM